MTVVDAEEGEPAVVHLLLLGGGEAVGVGVELLLQLEVLGNIGTAEALGPVTATNSEYSELYAFSNSLFSAFLPISIILSFLVSGHKGNHFFVYSVLRTKKIIVVSRKRDLKEHRNGLMTAFQVLMLLLLSPFFAIAKAIHYAASVHGCLFPE